MKYKEERLPTANDLAKYLGVSPSAVYQYNRDKRLLMLLGLKHKAEIDKKMGAGEKTKEERK